MKVLASFRWMTVISLGAVASAMLLGVGATPASAARPAVSFACNTYKGTICIQGFVGEGSGGDTLAIQAQFQSADTNGTIHGTLEVVSSSGHIDASCPVTVLLDQEKTCTYNPTPSPPGAPAGTYHAQLVQESGDTGDSPPCYESI
jgi:hypothetical protein